MYYRLFELQLASTFHGAALNLHREAPWVPRVYKIHSWKKFSSEINTVLLPLKATNKSKWQGSKSSEQPWNNIYVSGSRKISWIVSDKLGTAEV